MARRSGNLDLDAQASIRTRLSSGQPLEVRRRANVHTYRYRITVEGDLGSVSRQVFEEFKIEPNGGHTSLTADLDQAALLDAMDRIQSLSLKLTEIAITPEKAT